MSTEKVIETINKLNIEEKIDVIVKIIGELKGAELMQLNNAMQSQFGISDMPIAAAGGSAGAVDVADKPTKFDVKLKNIGDAKMAAIKFVKPLVAGWGLKEAKDYVENDNRDGLAKAAGKTFTKEEADQIMTELKNLGITGEIVNIG